MAASDHQHYFPAAIGTTSAPPPTPSTTQPTSTSDSSAATDLLSRLLHRLPPSLSNTSTTPLLIRRRSSLATSPPIIPLTDLNSSLSSLLPTVSELGFFQLTNHSIPSQLANSAESDSVSIFNLPIHLKHQSFPGNWPLGFDDDDDTGAGDSLFLDAACSTESSELELSSLREFTRELEKIGLAVVEALSCAMGLRNPVLDEPGAVSSLMWVSNVSGSLDGKMNGPGRFYPYVVGLHYQLRSRICSLLTDAGLVSVSCETDSVLVTLGDIAQVWSNGKLKKVRGKPTLGIKEGGESTLSMSLLVTLPIESTVSPLLPRAVINVDGDAEYHDIQDEDCNGECREEERLFNSFSFEDYAWRVYHERVPLKDPLDRYRNTL